MARIAGTTIPNEKRIVISLTYIYGIGLVRSKALLKEAGLSESIRTKDLTEDQINQIRDLIDKHGFRLEGDLKRDILANVKRLKEIGSYRGSRLSKHLPSRGQRTKTNSRTVRGNVRRTTGSGKRALTKT